MDLTKILIIALFILSGCSKVMSYQKTFINDSEMSLSGKKSEKFEQNFQTYREGAGGANGGKNGGGCGCN